MPAGSQSGRVATVVIVVLIAVSLAACVAHRVPASARGPQVRTRVDVSATIARGCFHCLEQAYDAAERTNPAQAFEAAILLALRAKELGIPFDEWLARARMLVDGEPRRKLYLDIATAIPADPRSGDRDAIFASTVLPQKLADAAREWRDALAVAPGSAPFREYVSLTLACSVDSRDDVVFAVDRALDQYADIPLVRFRAGLCRTKGPSLFADLRQADSAFVEADYLLGVYALGERPRPDYDLALERLMNAANAFPQSPSIWSALGDLRQLREEWSEALAVYDHIIERIATHRDALLGRMVALSRLERHEDAIAAASRIIDLGGWYIGQAFYWRAWNELALDQLDAARADADQAKTQMVNAAVFLVSGLIERRFKRFESAEHEFDQAHALDATACDASFYLGVVRAERAKLEIARTALLESETCYADIIAALRRRIEEINISPGRPDLKARLVAGQQSAIDEAQMRVEEARYLVSQIAARLGAN